MSSEVLCDSKQGRLLSTGHPTCSCLLPGWVVNIHVPGPISFSSGFLSICKASHFWKPRMWSYCSQYKNFEQLFGKDMKCGHCVVLGQTQDFVHARAVLSLSSSTTGRLSDCLPFSDVFHMEMVLLFVLLLWWALNPLWKKPYFWSGEIAQWVPVRASKPDDLCDSQDPHGGEKWLLQVVFWPPHAYHRIWHPPIN